jgi:hypothetical protein
MSVGRLSSTLCSYLVPTRFLSSRAASKMGPLDFPLCVSFLGGAGSIHCKKMALITEYNASLGGLKYESLLIFLILDTNSFSNTLYVCTVC